MHGTTNLKFETSVFSANFRKILNKHHENQSRGAQLFHAVGRKDGETDMAKLTVGFPNSVNAPRNMCSCNIYTDFVSLRLATNGSTRHVHCATLTLMWMKQFRSRVGWRVWRRCGTETEHWAEEKANTRSSDAESLWRCRVCEQKVHRSKLTYSRTESLEGL
jgi:hypothetical protein